MSNYQEALSNHYSRIWNNDYSIRTLDAGPMKSVNPTFQVLEFPPHKERKMWTYATNGMSDSSYKEPVEIHLFSNIQDVSLVNLLTYIAYYHVTGAHLNLWHTVNFGRPWQGSSNCEYGLVSLPYLDGPDLENVPNYPTKCYWLIPITEQERAFKIKFGIEELEEKFESHEINYVDANRVSVL